MLSINFAERLGKGRAFAVQLIPEVNFIHVVKLGSRTLAAAIP